MLNCAHESVCRAPVLLLPWEEGRSGLCGHVLVPEEWGSVGSKLNWGLGPRLQPLVRHRLVSDPDIAVSGSLAFLGHADVPAASLVAGRTVHSAAPNPAGNCTGSGVLGQPVDTGDTSGV